MLASLTMLAGRRTGLTLAVAVLAAASLVFLLRTFIPSLTATTHSYPAYYTAARLVVENRWSRQLYDDKWFEAQVLEITNGRVSDHFSLHPPTTSLLLVPIAWLDITQARVVWQLLNLGLVVAALVLLLDALAVQNTVWRILFIGFALVFPPLRENFRVGQAYVLILFLFALALWSELRERPISAGLGLGIAAGLKLSGVPLWFMLVARRRWRTLFRSFIVASLSALLGLVVLGWQGWLAFSQRILDYSKPVSVASHVSFQATPSFLQRLFVASPDFNPAPLLNLPALAEPLTLAITVGALSLMLWSARRTALELAFASAVTASVILFPMAIEYHYTLLLIPLAVMGSRCFLTRNPLDIVWFVVVLILLCVPFDWNAPRWSTRENMLLAYPRLYGGWLLWLWLLRKMMSPNPLNGSSGLGATP